jgi:3-methyladenine DNA glycosylase AlkC
MEPFKNLFNRPELESLSRHLRRVDPAFPAKKFLAQCLDNFDALELKERSARITDALLTYLPQDFPTLAHILRSVLRPLDAERVKGLRTDVQGVAGWLVMPLADCIAIRGGDNVPLALDVLRDMTQRFSAEFAIRPLIVTHRDEVLATLATWLDHPSEHVRRLISEGTRPRLPWGIRLNDFVRDPAPLLPLLTALRADPSEYVRRSVANNLNDISKDHPDVVLRVVQEWRGAHADTDRLLKHASRTMLKRGDTRTLELFGFSAPKLRAPNLNVATPRVRVGDSLEFTFDAVVKSAAPDQVLRLEYEIYFVTGTGRTSQRIFKISERPASTLVDGRLIVERRHSFVDRSIRKHHPGEHRLVMVVNGAPIAEATFAVIAAK